MDLSQSDIDKIQEDFLKLLNDLQMNLVASYETLSRVEAKKLIWNQLQKFMESN